MTLLEILPEHLVFKTFPVGPLQCNCTLLGDTTTGEALVVDPGGDADKILDHLRAHGLTLKGVYHTHAHFDHFLASGALKAATGAPLALHPADLPLWDNLERQCAMFGIPFEPAPPPDHGLADEEEIGLNGGLKGQCLHTPGHTPGSLCFHFEDLKLLLGGDTIFRGSIGRTDLWGGDTPSIERSIRERIYVLDEATCVITGHGPATTVGHELRHNPFVRP